MIRPTGVLSFLALVLWLSPFSAAAQGDSPTPHRLTVLVDAFGDRPSLQKEWGYSALVEFGGKRILFDTGNDSAGFADNVRTLGIDLTRLDAVVISHRHGDHTAGLRHLLRMNPGVTVYVPDDEAFGGPTPAFFFRQADSTLPRRMRYFDGALPARIPHGSAWQSANFVRVDSAMEIFPGIRVVRNITPSAPFNETPEISLVIDTDSGQVVIVGCSHPGLERIIGSIARTNPRIAMVAGGLHWVTTPPAEIERLAVALHDEWKIGAIAPGHCTGEVGFATLRRIFGKGYVYAGLGTDIDLASLSHGIGDRR